MLEYAGGGVYYLRNGGNNVTFSSFTTFGPTVVGNPLKDVTYRRRAAAAPTIVDVDGDGKLDVILGPAAEATPTHTFFTNQ